jgi:hypothetical protein
MRTDPRSTMLPGRRLLLGPLLLALGCQTYDFEPVPPVTIGQTTTTVNISANPLKPNLMLALDRSGSMALPFDSTPPSCGSCGQSGQPKCDPTTCPSRMDTVATTMSSFLADNATIARLGVAFYPQLTGATIADPTSGNQSNFCTATSSVDVPIVDSDDTQQLQASAQAVDFAIRTVQATASPCRAAGRRHADRGQPGSIAQHAGFGTNVTRQSFLLLMTDGLPNCNPNSGLNAP